MANHVQTRLKGQKNVVEWIRSDAFMATVTPKLQRRWLDLASKIETKLQGTGGDM